MGLTQNPLTPNASSDLNPKPQKMQLKEKKRGWFLHHKWKQVRVRKELLANICKVSGQNEILWVISNPQEIGSHCGKSDINRETAGHHELQIRVALAAKG